LFDSGPESQTHDFQPGLSPNGLFWVAEIPNRSFGSNGRRAGLRLRDFPLVDTFTFGGPTNVPGSVDIDLVWQATAPLEHRGKGKAVDPTDPAAFEGHFAPSRCYGFVSGNEIGFSFETNRLESASYYAQLGTERNGAYL